MENLTDHNDRLLLEEFLPYKLAVLAKAVSAAFAKAYGERFGITIPQWRVMSALGRFPDSPASKVVEHANLDKVQVSRALSGLVTQKYVVRNVDARDRRRSVLRLTTKGHAIYAQIIPVARNFEAQLTNILTAPDKAELSRLIDILVTQSKKL